MSDQVRANEPAKHDNARATVAPDMNQLKQVLPEPDAAAFRAIGSPSALSPRDALALQRTAGNRAVSGLIQAKLAVGAANDQYEQEADRVAEQVVSSQPQVASVLTGTFHSGKQHAIQRQEDEEEIQTKPAVRDSLAGFDAGPAMERSLASNRGAGSPLPEGVRSFMEPRFGADFSSVRLHTGQEAVQMNKDVQAQAFTHGSDIYMGPGRYDPGSDQGRRLLAHELTHVVQQTGGQPLAGGPAHPVQISAKRAPGVQRAFDADAFYQSLKSMGDEDAQAEAIEGLLRQWKKSKRIWSGTRKKYAALLIQKVKYDAELLGMVQGSYTSIFGEVLDTPEEIEERQPPAPEKVSTTTSIEGKRELFEQLQDERQQWNTALAEHLEDYIDYDQAWWQEQVQAVSARVNGLPGPREWAGQLGIGGNVARTYTSPGGTVGVTGKAGGFLGAEASAGLATEMDETGISAEAQARFLVGVRENAEVVVTLDKGDWGRLAAALREEFRTGMWGKASAEAKFGMNGIGAEAQAALALGAQFTVKGDLDGQVSPLGVGLHLNGKGRLFGGAEAYADLGLGVDLIEGVKAVAKAGAFAGGKAEVTGRAMFKLLGRDIIGQEITANVSFGAGAEGGVEISIPTFGESKFWFGAEAALGLGMGAEGAWVVNVANAYLTTKELLIMLRNLPATSKGYKPTLMMNEAEARRNLETLIGVYDAAIKKTDAELKAYKKTATAKRSLLS